MLLSLGTSLTPSDPLNGSAIVGLIMFSSDVTCALGVVFILPCIYITLTKPFIFIYTYSKIHAYMQNIALYKLFVKMKSLLVFIFCIVL